MQVTRGYITLGSQPYELRVLGEPHKHQASAHSNHDRMTDQKE